MSRSFGLAGIALTASVMLFPATAPAFDPQPDPPGNRQGFHEVDKSKSKSGHDSTKLPAVQKGGGVGVDPSNPHTPAWARDAFGGGHGGGGGGGGGR
jgi:hypothetical protein